MFLNARLFGLSVVVLSAPTFAAVDFVQQVLNIPGSGATTPPENTIAGRLGGFGYNPLTDAVYLGTSGADAGVFRVDNIGTTPTPDRLLTGTQMSTFTGSQPVYFGFTLNTAAYNGAAAYSYAAITDSHGLPSGGTRDDVKRAYTLNVTNPETPQGTATFQTAATAQQILDAARNTGTSLPGGVSQARFGFDGRSVYFTINTQAPGVYRSDIDGTVTQISTKGRAAEVGVQRLSATTDRILYRDDTNESVVYRDYNHVTKTLDTEKTLVTAQTYKAFMQYAGTQSFQIGAITADDDGNVYFQFGTNSGTQIDRNAVLRINADGVLSKVATIHEPA